MIDWIIVLCLAIAAWFVGKKEKVRLGIVLGVILFSANLIWVFGFGPELRHITARSGLEGQRFQDFVDGARAVRSHVFSTSHYPILVPMIAILLYLRSVWRIKKLKEELNQKS
ncbi:MAG: hypothetical protein SGI97_01935 [candidate division Zixibacteria bacterium]|nr:hypothetical protein [candidate division Zixibacteria bacterium]